MLVQQTSRFFHQKNLARLFFKLNITKAFDFVSWPFLIEVMQQMSFGQKEEISYVGSWGILTDYLFLWNSLADVVLHPNIEDKHIFSIAPDGH